MNYCHKALNLQTKIMLSSVLLVLADWQRKLAQMSSIFNGRKVLGYYDAHVMSPSIHSVLALWDERVHYTRLTPIKVSNCAPIANLFGAIRSELTFPRIRSSSTDIRGALGIIIAALGGRGVHLSFLLFVT